MKPTANTNIGPGTAATLALTTSSADVSATTVSQGKLLGIRGAIQLTFWARNWAQNWAPYWDVSQNASPFIVPSFVPNF